MLRKLTLGALIAVPVCYYFGLLAGAATYPGYSHVTRYASELGAAGAPFPALFNFSIIACGLAALVGAFGLGAALRERGGGGAWASAATIALGLWGAAMVTGGVFPMPDDRHGAFGLGLVAPLIPLFTLLALRPVPNTRGMKWFLALVFVASVILLAIMFGVGQLVTRHNVGLWQRVNTGVSSPWLAVLGWWLLTRDRSADATNEQPERFE